MINDAASLRLTNGETLEAWVYPVSIPPVNCTGTNCQFMDVVMKDSDRYYMLASSNNGQKPEVGGIFATGKHIIYAPSPLATNTWTHLAVTYDSTMLRLYVNGALVSSAPETALITTSTSPLFIGGDQTMGQYFNGRIDEVRVYNRGLSAAEIQADMNTPIATPTRAPLPPPQRQQHLRLRLPRLLHLPRRQPPHLPPQLQRLIPPHLLRPLPQLLLPHLPRRLPPHSPPQLQRLRPPHLAQPYRYRNCYYHIYRDGYRHIHPHSYSD